MRREMRWHHLFANSNGDVSVARLQIVWGSSILYLYILHLYIALPFLRGSSFAGEPPFSMFVDGLVVLIAGGVALVMEARIERVPASLPAPLKPPNSSTSRPPYWLDIAVLQLALGAFVVPLLSESRALEAVGWRLVTITIVSECVYLAFLSAQLVQKEELITLLEVIQEEKKRVATTDVDSCAAADELQKREQETRLDLLQRRAAVLMQQVGRAFTATGQSDIPGKSPP